MSAEPKTEKVRALDVKPYRWGIWCSIEGGEPFANEIVGLRWSEDGRYLWFMLESHNFDRFEPEQILDLVPMEVTITPSVLDAIDAHHAREIAARPDVTPPK